MHAHDPCALDASRCATALAAAAVPSCCPGALTRDPALWPLMRSIAPQARRSSAVRVVVGFCLMG